MAQLFLYIPERESKSNPLGRVVGILKNDAGGRRSGMESSGAMRAKRLAKGEINGCFEAQGRDASVLPKRSAMFTDSAKRPAKHSSLT